MKKLLVIFVIFISMSCIHNAFLPDSYMLRIKGNAIKIPEQIFNIDLSKNYRIKNLNSSLNLACETPFNGSNVWTKINQSNDLQAWTIKKDGSNYYLENKSACYVLDIDLSLINVAVYSYVAIPSQYWTFDYYNGHWRIMNNDSGLYLSAENDGVSDQTNVIQSNWVGSNGQLWDFIIYP